MSNNNYIDIHSHNKNEYKNTISIINIFPNQINKFLISGEHYYSVGIHPWYIREYCIDEDIDLIFKYSLYKNCKAIGEIGIDRITNFPLEKQKDIFLKQLTIAENIKKPVIVHCVKAFPEIIKIKNTRKIDIPWIIHGFNNNIQIANECIKNSCYLTFGYHLLVENSNAQNIFNKIPDNMIFLETDDKEISIEQVYNKAAEIKTTTIKEIKKIITNNYKKVFV